MEALHAGCPVITSRSSSLVEIGGPMAAYVDPYSIAELASALDRLSSCGPDDPLSEAEQARTARKMWAAPFTWDRFCTRIHDRVLHELTQGERRDLIT